MYTCKYVFAIVVHWKQYSLRICNINYLYNLGSEQGIMVCINIIAITG